MSRLQLQITVIQNIIMHSLDEKTTITTNFKLSISQHAIPVSKDKLIYWKTRYLFGVLLASKVDASSLPGVAPNTRNKLL
jgi:hypothetical protein